MKRWSAVLMAVAILMMTAGCKSKTPATEQPAMKAQQAETEQATLPSEITPAAIYLLDGGEKVENELYLDTKEADMSVLAVRNGGSLKSTGSNLVKEGDSTTMATSERLGLNAAALAHKQGKLELQDCTITSKGVGASGLYASGSGSEISAVNCGVTTAGDNAGGVCVSQGASAYGQAVDIHTTGANSPAVALQPGGGTVDINGGRMRTTGANAPVVFSRGKATIESATMLAENAEAAVIEGCHSITLLDSTLQGTKNNGVLIYETGERSIRSERANFSMTGGQLSSVDGSLFYVSNADAKIVLDAVALKPASGMLLTAAADRWGDEENNGGQVTLQARNQKLEGNISCDAASTVNLILENNTSLIGSINSDNTAFKITLNLDATSAWEVEGDSYIHALHNEVTNLSNIHDGGYTVYYDKSNHANGWLNGKSHDLPQGGRLEPFNVN